MTGLLRFARNDGQEKPSRSRLSAPVRTGFQARCRSAYNAANDLQHSGTIVRMTQAGVSNARLRALGKGTA